VELDLRFAQREDRRRLRGGLQLELDGRDHLGQAGLLGFDALQGHGGHARAPVEGLKDQAVS
jgi:hypothetical protein